MKKQLRLLLPVMLLVGAQVKTAEGTTDWRILYKKPFVTQEPAEISDDSFNEYGPNFANAITRGPVVKGWDFLNPEEKNEKLAKNFTETVALNPQMTEDEISAMGRAYAQKQNEILNPELLSRGLDLASRDASAVFNTAIPAGSGGTLSRSQLRAKQLEDLNEGWAAVEPAGLSHEEYENLANDVAKKQLSLQNPSMFTRAFDVIGMGYDKMKGAMNATVGAVSSGFASANAYLSPKFKAMGQTLLSSTDATYAWINQDRTHQAGSIAALVAVASGLGYVYRENLKAALKKVKASILGKEKLVKEDIALLAELEKHASKLEEPKPVVKEQVVQTPEPKVAAEVSAPVKKPSSRRRR